MNHMTQDSRFAPWWDDYEWRDCPHCDNGCIFKANSVKVCRICEGYGKIKVYRYD